MLMSWILEMLVLQERIYMYLMGSLLFVWLVGKPLDSCPRGLPSCQFMGLSWGLMTMGSALLQASLYLSLFTQHKPHNSVHPKSTEPKGRGRSSATTSWLAGVPDLMLRPSYTPIYGSLARRSPVRPFARSLVRLVSKPTNSFHHNSHVWLWIGRFQRSTDVA